MISRAEQTDVFDRLGNERTSINSDLKKIIQSNSNISFFHGREARRAGFFVKASKDLYQDIETKNFWKINKDSNKLERVVATDENGIIKE